MRRLWIGLLNLLMLVPSHLQADENLRLQDICRLKGQEENTLQGLGLVVGLRGTGDDSSKPTSRSLARMMQLMGSQIATDAQGVPDLKDIEKAGNVALVFITADIPPSGAQQGDAIDCTISAINAKSLEGGTLMLTPLLGPRADRPTVYALAQGQITLPDPRTPTSGTIYQGVKMEATVRNQFVSDDKITLVLDQDHSGFRTAQDVEDSINSFNQNGLSGSPGGVSANSQASSQGLLAHAIDQLHVVVDVPSSYRERPVQFVSLIMSLPIVNLQSKKRVVINEREGVIVIGEDVMISPVVVTHKNIAIEARGGRGGFVGLDTTSPTQARPKLKNLVDALNALAVPADDTIAIIKALKKKGDLFGEVVIQ